MRRCFSPLPLLHPSSHPCSVIPVKKSAHYPLDWLRHQHPIASNCGEKKKTAPELVGRTYEKKRAKSLNVINPATRLVGRQCVCVYRVNGLPWRPEPWVCRDRDVSELPPPPLLPASSPCCRVAFIIDFWLSWTCTRSTYWPFFHSALSLSD